MAFTAITKETQTYSQGRYIGNDRFELFGGVKMFFYDRQTIEEGFGNTGVFEITEVVENYPFYLIKWRKNKTAS